MEPCRAIACHARCNLDIAVMCKRHWTKLPAQLQRAIYDAHRPSEAWDRVVAVAVQYVAEIEGFRSRAPTVPIETTPIEGGEEIEAGELPLGTSGVSESTVPPKELYCDSFWRLARRLATALDDEIRENPYCVAYRALPTVELSPEWFDRVVVRECGIALDDPRRLEFIAWSVIDEGRRDGHTIVPTRDVLDTIQSAATVSFDVAVDVVRRMIAVDLIRPYRDDALSWLAVRSIDDAEESAARFLAKRIEASAL